MELLFVFVVMYVVEDGIMWYEYADWRRFLIVHHFTMGGGTFRKVYSKEQD